MPLQGLLFAQLSFTYQQPGTIVSLLLSNDNFFLNVLDYCDLSTNAKGVITAAMEPPPLPHLLARPAPPHPLVLTPLGPPALAGTFSCTSRLEMALHVTLLFPSGRHRTSHFPGGYGKEVSDHWWPQKGSPALSLTFSQYFT